MLVCVCIFNDPALLNIGSTPQTETPEKSTQPPYQPGARTNSEVSISETEVGLRSLTGLLSLPGRSKAANAGGVDS